MGFRTWLEAKNIIPMGDCFRFATMLAGEMLGDGVIPERDIVVVHAIVHPKWHERPYPHAWVESRGRCYDWQMRKTVGSLPAKDFYEEYRPTEIKRYAATKAIANMARHGHHGPWD